ncbi:MAG: SDR family oxidoreductase [Ruminiclostridium sp.]|nr:SDR family oxidoreductase [Ruminiclostridium sp.]
MMKDLFSLKNKVVVLTGGSGYLGSAVTEGILEFGASVVIADIAHKKHEETVSGRKAHGKSADVVCDVSDTASVREMFRKTKELYGKIDVLINCAAFGAGFGPAGTVDKMSDEDWTKGLDGTAGVTFRCTREVVPYFEENGGGNIINFSSMYGVVSPDPGIYGNSGQNNPVNYGAGKAAVLQITRYCAAHLAQKNIRVNSITPGPFPSPKNLPPEDFMNNLRNKTMLKRVGIPEDIVGAIILLASDASSFMTGSNIVVDGGWTAW